MAKAVMIPDGPVDAGDKNGAHYVVKGFRSLQDFQLCLRPGLNVLLGVNGSGKTNFIDFLDFLTQLIMSNCSTAVSSAGGVARVFSQESLKRKIPRVTAKVSCIADIAPEIIGERPNKRRLFKFEYEVDIRYSKFHTSIYIANERIKLKNLFNTEDATESDTTVGSLEIHRRSPLADDEVRWTVGSYLNSNSVRNPLRYLHAHRLGVRARGETVTDMRAKHLSQTPAIGPDESILTARLPFPALDAIRQALSRGRSFNLNPNRARTPDDISRPPVIEPDGAGLSTVLYQMQQAAKGDNRQAVQRRRIRKDALENVLMWTQLVISDLSDISANADPHTGKYLVYLHVGNPDVNLRIPLQSASDGTLKWLAFVCLIVSQGAEYAFEEPENFLHPMMQQYFVALLRESIEDKARLARFIVSTHSETIINQCAPEELILFQFASGGTQCSRIKNSKAVKDQINQTGFGLGSYYARNVLR